MKPKILIVDDDTAIRQQLFWMLCDDYEVMTADDLPSAIGRATAYEPAISILDLHLPPVPNSPAAGLRVLEHIKHSCPGSKVYIVSSEESMEIVKACFQSGADGFLCKPLDVEQLLMIVRHWASAQRLKALE